MNICSLPPTADDAAPYYFNYIGRVPAGDVRVVLDSQLTDGSTWLSGIADEQSRFRYAPDKWSLREVLAHVNDSERVFAFRALWFARGFDAPLPSFDQTVAASHALADRQPWADLVDEFRAVRRSTIALFRHLSPEAWRRSGVASGHAVSVHALAYIIAGHFIHHAQVITDKYAART